MADITITAANVLPGAGARVRHGVTAGATIAAGKTVVRDPTTDKYVLSDSNHATVALRKVNGIALNAASDGQPFSMLEGGPITIGATLTAGAGYYLSETPGGIQPVADLASGERSVLLGLATSTTVLDVEIQDSGVTI
jgi:hypothetical protein